MRTDLNPRNQRKRMRERESIPKGFNFKGENETLEERKGEKKKVTVRVNWLL